MSPLLIQTTYAELVERCATAGFSEAFPEDGTFTSKTIRGRKYWYFQNPTASGRIQRYVGVETAELLDRISRHRQGRHDERARKALVTTLVRLGMPRPTPDIGAVVDALARAGVFRLRGVLVGTVCFQTYPAMLGEKLTSAEAGRGTASLQTLRTDDVDIAQFRNVSTAVEDQMSPVLNVLRQVDDSFHPIPHAIDGRRVTAYRAQSGLRVDFLTPNEGPDSEKPQRLRALQTDAQPLRFLDFLVHDPEPAIVLYNGGIYVNVPRPERYALHKLIISQRRREGVAKRDKDIAQAAALLVALARKRPHELRSAWEEATDRGKTWRELLFRGLAQAKGQTRDLTLKAVNEVRQIIPGLDLTFQNPPAAYVFDRDIVAFEGEAKDEPVSCAISREALDDHFGTDGLDTEGRLESFRRNRSMIEQLARTKYLRWTVEEPNSVLLRTIEIPDLMRALPATTGRRPRLRN